MLYVTFVKRKVSYNFALNRFTKLVNVQTAFNALKSAVRVLKVSQQSNLQLSCDGTNTETD